MHAIINIARRLQRTGMPEAQNTGHPTIRIYLRILAVFLSHSIYFGISGKLFTFQRDWAGHDIDAEH